METLVLSFTAFVLLAAAVYAQHRIPYHTQGPKARWSAHALLVMVGAAFGVVSATVYTPYTGVDRVLVFLIGFGLVHVPAAFILFSKRRRGVTR